MYKQDIFIIGLIVGGFLFFRLSKFFKAHALKKRMSKARKSEKNAAKLLKQQGYTIISSQTRIPVVTYVDEKPYKNHVRADFIVRKGLKKYVAEVKTGELASQITTTGTRRQLLEYYLAYKPSGLLLVDMEKAKIKTVRFEVETNSKGKMFLKCLALLLIFLSAIYITYNFVLFKVEGGFI